VEAENEGVAGTTRRIEADRWRAAQAAELELWQRAQQKHGLRRLVWPLARPILRLVGSRKVTGDDWNLWWASQFDDYAFLPRHLGEFIELGCGPYTNTRLIVRGRETSRIVCSDPLAAEYVHFHGRWLAEAHKRGFVEIDDHPIEEIPFPDESFDVVVMINVLEHVRDADACMEKAAALTKPGGWLIVSSRVVAPDAAAKLDYDVWHPIRITVEEIERHLGSFAPTLRRVLPPSAAPVPDERFATFLFAGEKPGDQDRETTRP
jgi:SAM-dependent methyltransferase